MTTNGPDSIRSRRSARRNGALLRAARACRRAALLPLVALLAAGCDLSVEPTETVAPEAATGNLTGVNALLTGTYQRLQHLAAYGHQMLFLPDIMADHTVPRVTTNAYATHHTNSVGSHMGGWGTTTTVGRYHAINEANFTIASAEALTGDDAARNRIIGEALFLRALNYFDLARVYAYEPGREVGGWDAGLVLRTEPTRTAAAAEPRARSTNLETYQQIEADLLRSIELLRAGDRGVPFFATRSAAEALLARLYLYWERWADAEELATRALTGGPGRLATPAEYPGMWSSAPNIESIFEVNYNAATESLWVNDCQACYVHVSGTWFSVVPSAELLALYEPGDVRQQVLPTTPTGLTGIAAGIRYTSKFGNYRGANTDNAPVIRFSELLLIRAEARAMRGQAATALEDLNTLRAARSASPISAEGPALIEAIMTERRRELAFEGHRWFDLKRRGMDIPKPAQGASPAVPYSDFRILAGLPSTEVLNNPLLAQNPGY